MSVPRFVAAGAVAGVAVSRAILMRALLQDLLAGGAAAAASPFAAVAAGPFVHDVRAIAYPQTVTLLTYV